LTLLTKKFNVSSVNMITKMLAVSTFK
jgi:hypothetical protein